MAALGSQSIASSYEQLLHVDANGGGDGTNHVSVKDGDNETTFGFTIASDALMMSSTNRLEFGDTGTYIHQSADGVLDLVSDTEIEINATTIDINGAVDVSGNVISNSNYAVEGYSTGRNVIRTTVVRIGPGDNPGTNINATQNTTAGNAFNTSSYSNGTNIEKSASSGSFALNAAGTILSLDLTETCVGMLSFVISLHDINSSSASELYVPNVEIVSGNIDIRLLKSGTSGLIDLTTIMDAGDLCDVTICYVTSS